MFNSFSNDLIKSFIHGFRQQHERESHNQGELMTTSFLCLEIILNVIMSPWRVLLTSEVVFSLLPVHVDYGGGELVPELRVPG